MVSAIAADESPIQPGAITVRKARTPLGDTIATLRRRPLAITGLAIVLIWLVLGITAPLLPLDNPNQQNLSARLEPPGREHVFGTDELGRDLFSRVIYGARV